MEGLASTAAPQEFNLNGRSKRAIAVCLQKSGSHLLMDVMRRIFQFRPYGAVRPDPSDPNKRLDLTAKEISYLSAIEGGSLNEDQKEEAAHRVWERMYWSWRNRLGVPVKSRYDQNTHLIGERFFDENPESKFLETPENLCWFFASLPVYALDGRFIADWYEDGDPKLIYLIRDPRDMLVSFIDYLMNRTKHGHGTYKESLIYEKILAALPSDQDRIDYAISDPMFPGRQALRESLWMVAHPDVLTVRYEDLSGRGTNNGMERKARAVNDIARHLGCTDFFVGPDELYAFENSDTFTFYKAKIGRWRESFNADLEQRFSKEFATEMKLLGYA